MIELGSGDFNGAVGNCAKFGAALQTTKLRDRHQPARNLLYFDIGCRKSHGFFEARKEIAQRFTTANRAVPPVLNLQLPI